MPFVPMTPEEMRKYKPPCTDPQHDPPTHIVITTTKKWRCPSCGETCILEPSGAYFRPKPMGKRWVPDLPTNLLDSLR